MRMLAGIGCLTKEQGCKQNVVGAGSNGSLEIVFALHLA